MTTETAARELATLPPVQRRLLWTLGFGAFGLAFSITTISVALPPVLHTFTTSGSLIGLVIGAEGFFALTLSPVIGPWSDGFHTPLGRRRPFMLVGLGPMAFCLLLVPFMPNLWTTTLLVLAFYFAYYLYEPPYRGLYPDVLPPSAFGRAQGVQHVLRGTALGIALVGGNFLLKVWMPAPFLTAAFITTAACGLTILLVREDGGHGRVFEGFWAYIKRSWFIFWQEGDVRRFLLANSAWEGTFAAARSFVILYVIDGLHESKTVSGEILAAVAVGYVIAALVAGRLGDRFGLARVIFFASFVYGTGFLVGGLAEQWHSWYFGLIIPVAIAGGTVMTLAWGLLYKIVPAQHRGAVSGLATTTKGIGLLVGAPVAGLAIDIARPHFDATNGYQILWPVCALPILGAIPLLVRLIHAEAEAEARGGEVPPPLPASP
jgi:MFS family permease